MYSRAICPKFCWKMQEETFCLDVRMLQVGGCDLVLGMDRLYLVVAVVFHTRALSIEFFRSDTWISLLSSQEDPKLVTTESDKLEKCFSRILEPLWLQSTSSISPMCPQLNHNFRKKSLSRCNYIRTSLKSLKEFHLLGLVITLYHWYLGLNPSV